MAVLPIVRMGNPVLRRVAAAIPVPASGGFDDDLRQLAADMVDTMLDAPGIGLAAPQVDIGKRIIVFRVPPERASGDQGDTPMGPQVLINPEFVPVGSETVLGWEGCLSIPGLRGVVPRYRRIRYRGYDLDGILVEREAANTHARVIQHELDHLDAVLYLDRMENLATLTYMEEQRFFGPDVLSSGR
ncbi:peptide deformylase [Niveispirillum lacus]|uniref:Peptide deformylase n=1 Tax=Niveispirillum lacus TaxID=1981099 RepID=A0A255Z0L7_9PROT|nr:peptide deformylase [Niveispirillum lacus]OYQ35006.1 peptide deformylase [Niveispirillum lacus]